ncbi:MAG: transposase [Planctomycetaceae bacterium]
MTTRRRRRHTPEQIVRKLRDADAMLNAGKDEAAVLQALEVSQATYDRWRKQFAGMKAEEAKRLKELEEENSASRRSWLTRRWTFRCSGKFRGNLSAIACEWMRAHLESGQPCSSCNQSSRFRSVERVRWWISHEHPALRAVASG